MFRGFEDLTKGVGGSAGMLDCMDGNIGRCGNHQLALLLILDCEWVSCSIKGKMCRYYSTKLNPIAPTDRTLTQSIILRSLSIMCNKHQHLNQHKESQNVMSMAGQIVTNDSRAFAADLCLKAAPVQRKLHPSSRWP